MSLAIILVLVYVTGVFVTPFVLGLLNADPELIPPSAVFWPLAAVFVLFGISYGLGLRIADWMRNVSR